MVEETAYTSASCQGSVPEPGLPLLASIPSAPSSRRLVRLLAIMFTLVLCLAVPHAALAADASSGSSSTDASVVGSTTVGSTTDATVTGSTTDAASDSSADSLTTVKVGYFYNAGYLYKDDAGEYRGFDVEYLYTLAGYADLDIQFVDYDNLQDCLDGLESGQIDMVTDLAKTDERESKFLFSSQSLSPSHISVMTRTSDDRYSPGDPSCLADANVGILKNTIVVTLYTQWCEDHGMTPHVIEYDSIQERNAALESGEVDAVAAGSTIEGTQKIVEIPSSDLYCMFNKDRIDIKTKVDDAMNMLSLDDPTFTTTIRLKYFPATKNTTPTYSAKEKAYLAAHPTIRVALLSSNEPFSSRDADGTVSGVIPDYYAHLSDLVGVKFQCIAYDTKDEECAALASGEVDMIGLLQRDVFYADSRGLILSQPILDMNLVLVARAGTTDVKTIATTACTEDVVSRDMDSEGYSYDVKVFDSGEQCFSALLDGTVDAVVCAQPVASWFLINNRLSDYSFSAFGTLSWATSAAFPSGSDGNMLRIILDKALAVDSGYANQLVAENTLQSSADLTKLIDRIPVGALIAAVVGLLVLMAALVFALAVIVRRRSHERALAAQQLEADRREANIAAMEHANEVQRNFFGAVSHDMRTPLNGIVGYTGLALSSDDDAKMRDYLRKIQTSSALLSDLVDDTLAMSRLDSSHFALNPTPNDSCALLQSIVAPIRALADQKGVEFVQNVDSLQKRTIIADRVNLQKVFLNLLTNAVKFTPTGGTVRFEVSLADVKDEGRSKQAESQNAGSSRQAELVATVGDTGIGISQEFMPHLFEPFTQENAADAGTAGTGLGLSITKRIVDAMGGTIDVASTKGKGTTFTVRLRFDQVTTQTGAMTTAASAAGAADAKTSSSGADTDGGKTSGSSADAGYLRQGDRLAGKKVLVCEDNAMNAEITQVILEAQGATVVTAVDGARGLDAFIASSIGEFYAVLLDLRMPVMDGIQTAKALRALPRADAKDVIILAVSADAFPQNVQECLDAGMDGHIAKPIDPAELLKALTSR